MGTHKGLTIPDYTDPADVPKAFIELIDSGIIPPFPNAAAADTAGLGEGAVAVIGGQLQIKSGGNWGAVATPYTLPSASSSVQGGVKLNDAVNSNLAAANAYAASPKAVKAVQDALNAFKNSFQAGYVTLQAPTTGALATAEKAYLTRDTQVTFPKAFSKTPFVVANVSRNSGSVAHERRVLISTWDVKNTGFKMIGNWVGRGKGDDPPPASWTVTADWIAIVT